MIDRQAILFVTVFYVSFQWDVKTNGSANYKDIQKALGYH